MLLTPCMYLLIDILNMLGLSAGVAIVRDLGDFVFIILCLGKIYT